MGLVGAAGWCWERRRQGFFGAQVSVNCCLSKGKEIPMRERSALVGSRPSREGVLVYVRIRKVNG